ncbi:MAG TPA: hypothetical protein V6D09_05750 [Leptolyngbyaceae cyanobacterium]
MPTSGNLFNQPTNLHPAQQQQKHTKVVLRHLRPGNGGRHNIS